MESFLISLEKREEVAVEEAAVGMTGGGANEARVVDVGRRRVDVVVAEADLVEYTCTR